MSDATIKDAIDAAANGKPEPITEFPHGNGRFVIRDTDSGKNKAGVYFSEKDNEGNYKPERLICSPLRVIAQTRDASGNSWGRLLQWYDRDKRLHEWACPMESFSGDATEFRAELLRGGVVVAQARMLRNLLSAYIQTYPTDKRARCVDRLGWHDERYVLPDQTIGGNDNEIVRFQNPHFLETAFSTSGTIEEWAYTVAALAAGNSRVTFAVSLAFAGALLDIVGEDGVGERVKV